jgi:spore photoproduct lyase
MQLNLGQFDLSGEKCLMTGVTIKKVLVEEKAHLHAFTQQCLSRLQDIPVQRVNNLESKAGARELEMGKDILHFLSFKGRFFKPCPGAKPYICCGYQILNIGTNCPLDCSYCVLQSYFNQPNLRVFVNVEEELNQVLSVIDGNPGRIFRVGTGEFTDSLAMDHITRWTDLFLPMFSKRKNAVLELKTKTRQIKRLLNSKHRDRIVVSWSLNSPYIASEEEHRAASLNKRLEAARQCQAEGFILGFHFDPLIRHSRWEDEYLKTLDLLDKHIDPKGIIWISLGAFRFMPGLKAIIRNRHTGTHILNGEFVGGLDGKLRYFKPIRIDLYSFMQENLEKWHPSLCTYLCMESDDVWQKSLRWSPKNSVGLSQYLDRRVVEVFG